MINLMLTIFTYLGDMGITTRQPGSTGGLTVLLFVNQQDYLYASSPTEGFRVSFTSITVCLQRIRFVLCLQADPGFGFVSKQVSK